MADELHLKNNDQQATCQKRVIDGTHGHCGGIDGVHAPQLEHGKFGEEAWIVLQ